jgi:hypothetical protein
MFKWKHTAKKEDPIYVSPKMKLRGFVPNFHIRVAVSLTDT